VPQRGPDATVRSAVREQRRRPLEALWCSGGRERDAPGTGKESNSPYQTPDTRGMDPLLKDECEKGGPVSVLYERGTMIKNTKKVFFSCHGVSLRLAGKDRAGIAFRVRKGR